MTGMAVASVAVVTMGGVAVAGLPHGRVVLVVRLLTHVLLVARAQVALVDLGAADELPAHGEVHGQVGGLEDFPHLRDLLLLFVA